MQTGHRGSYNWTHYVRIEATLTDYDLNLTRYTAITQSNFSIAANDVT